MTDTTLYTLGGYGSVTADVIPNHYPWLKERPAALINVGHSDENGEYSFALTPRQAVALAHRLLQQADAATQPDPATSR